MASYTACEGTGLAAHEVRRMNTAGLGSKFSHLHGKLTGKCAACGKSVRLQNGSGPVPRHADARPAGQTTWYGAATR